MPGRAANERRIRERNEKRENALKAEAEKRKKRLEEEKKRKDDANAKQQRQKQLEACRKCLDTNKKCNKPCKGFQPKEINRLTEIDITEIKKKLGINKLKF